MKVRDVMTKDVISVTPKTSLKEVARVLAQTRISGLPVVADDGKVVGVISEGDLLFKERGPTDRRGVGVLGWLLDPHGAEAQLKLEASTVAEAMTMPPVTIESRRPIPVAAALMLEQGVNRLPVVDGGKLVGIVTRADLVRAFARDDAEISREIKDEVFRRGMWLDDPDEISVSIVEGEVRLDGQVERRTEAEVAEALVGQVTGVVSVDSHLTWREDDGSTK
jgi:CBS domain-containing protein